MKCIKCFIGSIALFLFFTQAQAVSACAIATFEQPLSVVDPAGRSDAFLLWDGSTERLIIQPKLKGNAQEFGMAFAFPSRPKVKETSREIFTQLEEYTKPRPAQILETGSDAMMFGAPQAAAPQVSSPVQVLETRDVGDFTVSVLSATDSDALVEWLLQNQYSFSENDKANFEYYVRQGGYFFTVLKIRTEARAEIPSYLLKAFSDEYRFTPIEFTFDTFTPVFPLRLARDDDPLQYLRLYTVSNLPLVVWGGDISFAGKIDWTLPQELASLTGFDMEGKWLTALDLSIDPVKIEEDLEPALWSAPIAIHIFQNQDPTVLFPEDTPYRSGIVLSQASSIIPEYSEEYPRYLNSQYLIAWEELFPIALFFLALYVYISSVLFVLAGKLHTRNRWLAWIPVARIYLFVAMAKKRWGWFIWLCVAPIIVIVSLAIFEDPPYDNFSDEATDMVLWFSLYIFFVSLVGWFFLLERIMTALVKEQNRPSWWGTASVIVPPLGLIFLGILAWGKGKKIAELEAVPVLSEQIPPALALQLPPTVALSPWAQKRVARKKKSENIIKSKPKLKLKRKPIKLKKVVSKRRKS